MMDLKLSKPPFINSAASSLPRFHGEFVYLQPGELWTGQGHCIVKTLLGSCVTITLWHRPTRQAAMCHYLLPDSKEVSKQTRLGYTAAQVFKAYDAWRLEKKLLSHDIEAKIFGGGNMFARAPGQYAHFDVAKRNIDAGLERLQQRGYSLVAKDVGGERHRTLVFDVFSGDVWIRYGPLRRSS